jgi:hypothetical protein
MATDSWIQVAVDGLGKRVRNFYNNIGGQDVYQQVVTLAKSDGTVMDDPSRSGVTQPISAASLPLPTGAALDSSLATIAADIALQAKLTDTQPVSAAALPLPAGAATETTLAGRLKPADTLAGVTTVGAVTAITNPVAVTNANLDAALSTRTKPADQQHAIIDSGSVGVNNFPATQPVSGSVSVSNFPATQPVSAAALPLPAGAATDAGLIAIAADLAAQARLVDTQPVSLAAPVAVTGAFYHATQPVSVTGEALMSLRTQRVAIGRNVLRPRAGRLRRMGLHA